jgi:hypothetical protein
VGVVERATVVSVVVKIVVNAPSDHIGQRRRIRPLSGFRTPDPLIIRRSVRKAADESVLRTSTLVMVLFGVRLLASDYERLRLVPCHLWCKSVTSADLLAAKLLSTTRTRWARH